MHFLLGFLLSYYTRNKLFSRPPQTRVPQLVNLDYKTAETTLHNSKLNIRVLAHRYDPPVEPGNILFQTPQAGESVACGTVVGITISKESPHNEGPLPIPSPSYMRRGSNR